MSPVQMESAFEGLRAERLSFRALDALVRVTESANRRQVGVPSPSIPVELLHTLLDRGLVDIAPDGTVWGTSRGLAYVNGRALDWHYDQEDAS